MFAENCTQWRTGSSGLVGLDYSVFHHELDRRKVVADDYEDTMDALRVIEREALMILNKG